MGGTLKIFLGVFLAPPNKFEGATHRNKPKEKSSIAQLLLEVSTGGTLKIFLGVFSAPQNKFEGATHWNKPKEKSSIAQLRLEVPTGGTLKIFWACSYVAGKLSKSIGIGPLPVPCQSLTLE